MNTETELALICGLNGAVDGPVVCGSRHGLLGIMFRDKVLEMSMETVEAVEDHEMSPLRSKQSGRIYMDF